MPALSSISNIKIRKKTVLVRIDSDIDVKRGKILDDTRLLSSLETIHKLLKNKCKVVLVGHLGRPDGHDPELSLNVIAKWYSTLFKKPVKKHSSPFGGWEIGSSLVLLENIRYFTEEEANDRSFAKELASLADIFVNEAFAVSHRSHASTVGVSRILPSYAGIHFTKEVKTLESILKNPKRPLAVLIGGSKIETKLPMVETMHETADFVLVGGKVADNEKELLKVNHDHAKNKRSVLLIADLDSTGLDITDKSIANFIEVLSTASTVVWNGPVGKTGDDPVSEKGTRLIANSLVHSHAFTIVGGGDTLSYLRQHKLLDKFSFVSTGGGAMLEFLSGRRLPAVEVLMK